MRETEKGSNELRYFTIAAVRQGLDRIFIESPAVLSDAGSAFTTSNEKLLSAYGAVGRVAGDWLQTQKRACQARGGAGKSRRHGGCGYGGQGGFRLPVPLSPRPRIPASPRPRSSKASSRLPTSPG